MRRSSAALLSCLLPLVALAFEPPSTIYHSANVYTLDPARPRAEAIAIADGHILAAGSDAEVRALAGPDTKTIDLAGATVLPGLIDAHGHMTGLGGLSLGVLDLSETRSFDEVIAAVKARAGELDRGTWILGRGWDHESWPVRKLPTHNALSQAVPDHPVWLSRVDGHAALANQLAMFRAGISAGTPDPSGGEIILDESGAPTGVFVDNAEGLIERAIPASARARPEDLLLAAQDACLALGLTGVHDAGISPDLARVYMDLEQRGLLRIRVYAMMNANAAADWFEEHEPYIGDRFTLRAAKLYIDGAMGSRGAWLLEPYADRPASPGGAPYTGLAVADPATIEQAAAHALEHGYQVCTHAIGDRGNRETLDAYERALRAHFGGDPPLLNDSICPRFRIEHAQLLSPADIPRFAALGVIPSMQPTHCTSDMRWVDARTGAERATGAYAWASLLRTGAPIAAGSDFPVESPNPFYGIYSAFTRQNRLRQPAAGWHYEQRMTRQEALRAFTLDAAFAAFEENSRGSITPGKLADLTIVDRDIMTCEPQSLRNARVVKTIIGGEIVYEWNPPNRVR